jgi:hypothetical protein
MKTGSTFTAPDTSAKSIESGLNRVRERFAGSWADASPKEKTFWINQLGDAETAENYYKAFKGNFQKAAPSAKPEVINEWKSLQAVAPKAEAPSPNAYEAFQNARDFWHKNVVGQAEKKGLIGKLSPEGGLSPEKAVERLKTASLDDITKLRESMPAENFTNFRQGLLTQILQKNSKPSPTSGELIYNGPQLAKDLFGRSGIGEARLKALTTPEEFTFLKELAQVGERMGSSWRIAGNPSGTAHTLYTIHLMSQLGSGAGAIIAGEEARKHGGTGLGLAAAGAFLTPYALARLITSNVGRQYLISGFPSLERGIARVLPVGIAGTHGILSGRDPNQIENMMKGKNAIYQKELSNSRRAIASGVPADQVKAMFKQRTGKEYPE